MLEESEKEHLELQAASDFPNHWLPPLFLHCGEAFPSWNTFHVSHWSSCSHVTLEDFLQGVQVRKSGKNTTCGTYRLCQVDVCDQAQSWSPTDQRECQRKCLMGTVFRTPKEPCDREKKANHDIYFRLLQGSVTLKVLCEDWGQRFYFEAL